MSKHRVAVLKVVSSQLSVTAAAAEYGISRGHLHRLLHRYRDDGIEAVDPRSRRPRTNPGRTTDHVRERIVALRTELAGCGLDAGPLTIAWHLGRERLAVPSTSTIRLKAERSVQLVALSELVADVGQAFAAGQEAYDRQKARQTLAEPAP